MAGQPLERGVQVGARSLPLEGSLWRIRSRSAAGHSYLANMSPGACQSLKRFVDQACERKGEEEIEFDLAERQRSLRVEGVHRYALALYHLPRPTLAPQCISTRSRGHRRDVSFIPPQ